jgi:ribulose-phosphate 3-epimerase
MCLSIENKTNSIADNTVNSKKLIEIVPAILSKDIDDFLQKVKRSNFTPIIQIDLMDGEFVDNKTISLDDINVSVFENRIVEYHLMVKKPKNWINKIPDGKNSIIQVHVESCMNESEQKEIAQMVLSKGCIMCWAINPDTPIDEIKYMKDVNELLVMTVYPGKSGQNYIPEMEKKISALRAKYPNIIIEVDGGVNEKTLVGALKAGADRLVGASAIFSHENTKQAYQNLKNIANSLRGI